VLHLTGITVSEGVIPDEKINKPTEQTESSINRRADFLIGITSSFLGRTKIIVKSYSTK
jgi:hypothetical protein